MDDAGKFVFNRIFNGNNAKVFGIDRRKKGVEGSRFSAAGGAGDQDDAVGKREKAPDFRFSGGIEAEEFEVESLLAEQAEADAFAIDRGNGRDADIDGLPAELEGEPAILGQAPFGNIEVGHDFEAGNDRGLEELELGWDRDFPKDAIDAVADLEIVFQWFDVNVGGAFVECFADELVDETDDGGFRVVTIEDVGFLTEIGKVVGGGGAFEHFRKGFGPNSIGGANAFEDGGA